jgi:hypothetical protein|tara:strand:+ start:1546 stop:1704 length:159 start_codon:yes stop_codon:yes gene_type:complete
MANRTKGNTNQKLDKLNKLNVLWKKAKKAKTDDERKTIISQREQIKQTLKTK